MIAVFFNAQIVALLIMLPQKCVLCWCAEYVRASLHGSLGAEPRTVVATLGNSPLPPCIEGFRQHVQYVHLIDEAIKTARCPCPLFNASSFCPSCPAAVHDTTLPP